MSWVNVAFRGALNSVPDEDAGQLVLGPNVACGSACYQLILPNQGSPNLQDSRGGHQNPIQYG
jgi:hypothetical protein